MADDEQKPGLQPTSRLLRATLPRTLTFTAGGEAWELPTTGWRGQIRRKPDKNAELVGVSRLTRVRLGTVR